MGRKCANLKQLGIGWDRVFISSGIKGFDRHFCGIDLVSPRAVRIQYNRRSIGSTCFDLRPSNVIRKKKNDDYYKLHGILMWSISKSKIKTFHLLDKGP